MHLFYAYLCHLWFPIKIFCVKGVCIQKIDQVAQQNAVAKCKGEHTNFRVRPVGLMVGRNHLASGQPFRTVSPQFVHSRHCIGGGGGLSSSSFVVVQQQQIITICRVESQHKSVHNTGRTMLRMRTILELLGWAGGGVQFKHIPNIIFLLLETVSNSILMPKSSIYVYVVWEASTRGKISERKHAIILRMYV